MQSVESVGVCHVVCGVAWRIGAFHLQTTGVDNLLHVMSERERERGREGCWGEQVCVIRTSVNIISVSIQRTIFLIRASWLRVALSVASVHA